jgi:hypothetical protein
MDKEKQDRIDLEIIRVQSLLPKVQNELFQHDMNHPDNDTLEYKVRLKICKDIRLKPYIDSLTELEKVAYDIAESHLESSFIFERCNCFNTLLK